MLMCLYTTTERFLINPRCTVLPIHISLFHGLYFVINGLNLVLILTIADLVLNVYVFLTNSNPITAYVYVHS